MQARKRLGLPAGKRVVLYAPTWRDDQNTANGRYPFELRLDLQRARAALGADHVLLLRLRHLITERTRIAEDGFAFDVSAHPDINELYLDSDVLVTDYSSAVFDFAGTGRPTVFFTYDLESYRDSVRGFSLDFERLAPGPLLATCDEVLDAVRDVDAVAASYQSAYTRFTQTFCPYDDGRAAARTVSRLLREEFGE